MSNNVVISYLQSCSNVHDRAWSGFKNADYYKYEVQWCSQMLKNQMYKIGGKNLLYTLDQQRYDVIVLYLKQPSKHTYTKHTIFFSIYIYIFEIILYMTTI